MTQRLTDDLALVSDVPTRQGDFQIDTTAVMGDLSQSFEDLVGAVSGDIRRPTDLQKILKLDSKLCWQVFNVIRAHASLSAAQHVPGAPSLGRLLAAAEEAKVAAPVLASVRSAIQHFNDLVAFHGPDRPSFDSMVTAASSGEDSASTDLYHRRNAFRSESHIWGVQVDAYISATLIHPSAEGSGKDECTLTTRIGQRRLRSDAPVVVHRSSTHSSFKMLPANVRKPLDLDAADRLQAPLLPQFCSDPLPPMQTVQQENGWTQVEVRGGAVGRQASFDLTFASVVRNVPFTLDAEGHPMLRQSIRFITPAGMLVMDTLVHRPTFGKIDPRLVVFPRTDGDDPPQTFATTQRLPVNPTVAVFSAISEKVAIAEFPRYRELLEYACQRMTWNLDDFDVHRIRLPFPILNSIVRTESTLPKIFSNDLSIAGN